MQVRHHGELGDLALLHDVIWAALGETRTSPPSSRQKQLLFLCLLLCLAFQQPEDLGLRGVLAVQDPVVLLDPDVAPDGHRVAIHRDTPKTPMKICVLVHILRYKIDTIYVILYSLI